MTIQESRYEFTEREIQSARVLQKQFREDRAYHAISDYLKFNIKIASRENLRRLRAELGKGEKSLSSYCVRKVEVPTTYWDTIAWLYHKVFPMEQSPEVAALLPGEVLLMQLIMKNLTLKHTTRQNINDIKELVSVRERMRRGENVENCNTYRHSRDEFVYFTFGIGDHATDYNTDPEHQEILIDVNEFLKENPGGLDGMWVSGHDSCYLNGSVSSPVKLGDATFSFYHDRKAKTKTYIYERGDGSRFERTLEYRDEVLCGNDVVPGIAMQFIQHLRYIGGTYREHILQTAMDQTLDDDVRFGRLSAAMQAMMPGWVYPEAKVPVKVSLENPSVIRRDNTAVKKKYRYVSDDSEIYIAIQTHDRKKLQEYVDAGNDFAIRFTNGKTPLTLAINYQSPGPFRSGKSHRDFETYPDDVVMKTLHFLVANGASVLETDSGHASPISHAVAAQKLSFIRFLLKVEEADPNDSMIVRTPTANTFEKFELAPINLLLSQPKSKATLPILRLLLAAGTDVKTFGAEYLNMAVQRNGGAFRGASIAHAIVELLIQYGADPSERTLHGGNALLTCVEGAKFFRDDGLVAMMNLLENGAPVDFQFSPSVPHIYAGYTALHLAVEKGFESFVIDLLLHGANPNLRSINKSTPLLIAQRSGFQNIESILRKYRAHTGDKLPSDIIPFHKYSVVVVITGKDKYGEEVLVLGQKRDHDGQINEKLMFPGGFKDFGDATFEVAAIREAEEETNLNLLEGYSKGEIRPRLLHSQKMVSDDKQTLARIVCYHIDVGSQLGDTRLVGKDDLIELAPRRLKDFDPKRGTFKDKPVRFSNTIIISNLKSEDSNWRKDLEEALLIENLGVSMLKKAFEEKNEKEAIRILQHPSFFDVMERMNVVEMIQILGENPNREICDLLSEHVARMKHDWFELRKIIEEAAKYGHEKICQCVLMSHEFEVCEIMSFVEKSGKGGHIELALMFWEEAISEKRKEEWEFSGDEGYSGDDEMDDELRQFDQTFPPSIDIALNSMFIGACKGGRTNVLDYVLPKIELTKSFIKCVGEILGEKGHSEFIVRIGQKLEGDSKMQSLFYRKCLPGAAKSNRVELVQFLVEKGVNPYIFKRKKFNDDLPFTPVVDKNRGWLFQYGDCPFEQAISNGAVDSLRILLSAECSGSEVDAFFSESKFLLKSVISENKDLVEVILNDKRANLDLTYRGKTALIYSLESSMRTDEWKNLAVKIAEGHIQQAINTVVGRRVNIVVDDLKIESCDGLSAAEQGKLFDVLGGEAPAKLSLEQCTSLLEQRHEQYKDHRYAQIVYNVLAERCL